jgi:hypothetical protein
MSLADLAALLAGGLVLGGLWASLLRSADPIRARPESPDPLDRGTALPAWLTPLYPLLWPLLPVWEGIALRRGAPLAERIARSGYTPYATVSAVWAARLRGMALGLLAMIGGSLLTGLLLGTLIPGILGGLAAGLYGVLSPDRRIAAAIAARKRRFRSNMLLVLAAARGFLRGGRAWDDALSRAAVGDGVFANWARFLVARYTARGEAGLQEALFHAPDPRDPYLIRFMDGVRAAISGGAGFEVILSSLIQDLGSEMEQEVSERVTAVEPYVMAAGILAIMGYMIVLLYHVFAGGQDLLGF